MSDDTTSRCPVCGDEYDDRQEFQPEEGPNKSEDVVEGFYHDRHKMCTRTLNEGCCA